MISKRPRYLAPITLACVLVVTSSTRAHHSHGNYVDTFTDIEGVVKEVHLVNPHSWVYIEVKGPSGQVLKWSLEASSRIALERIGVTHEYIKAGDSIKVRCHPLRDKPMHSCPARLAGHEGHGSGNAEPEFALVGGG